MKWTQPLCLPTSSTLFVVLATFGGCDDGHQYGKPKESAMAPAAPMGQRAAAPAPRVIAPKTPRPLAPSPPRKPFEPPAHWRTCESAKDCVAVLCRCNCSGCGGFAYEDVVHRKFEKAWYRGKACKGAVFCYRRCCPPRTIACRKGICAVIQGKRRRSKP